MKSRLSGRLPRIAARQNAGVRPTGGGSALAEKARTLLADYDSGMAEEPEPNIVN